MVKIHTVNAIGEIFDMYDDGEEFSWAVPNGCVVVEVETLGRTDCCEDRNECEFAVTYIQANEAEAYERQCWAEDCIRHGASFVSST